MDQKKAISFLTVWISITISALILSVILGQNFVLGNVNITKPVAGLIFGLVATLAFFAADPIASKLDIKVKDEKIWAGIYFVTNAIVIWIIKRLATLTGIGVSNIIFVLVIAVVVTLVERAADKYSQKMFAKK